MFCTCILNVLMAVSCAPNCILPVFYSQERFTQDMQPHYIYSPREMTRWVRGICEAIRPMETLSLEGLVRIWAHEALRLFQDRSEIMSYLSSAQFWLMRFTRCHKYSMLLYLFEWSKINITLTRKRVIED